jgi:squalene-hopene/tetraprenyl-beta-curcumene cyclase/sporulenol synthase
MARRIERTVRDTQNDDGGWGMQPGDPSDDVSTAYGLTALCYGSAPRPVGRALSWLLAHQNTNGGYSGPPDMVGPRPFAYHFPILTDAPVLLAFGHVRARVQQLAAISGKTPSDPGHTTRRDVTHRGPDRIASENAHARFD